MIADAEAGLDVHAEPLDHDEARPGRRLLVFHAGAALQAAGSVTPSQYRLGVGVFPLGKERLMFSLKTCLYLQRSTRA